MPRRLGLPLIMLPAVGSTNDVAFALVENGAPAGTTVVAARQTGGRGRSGRSFSSPEGGLYLSVVLAPDLPHEDLVILPIAAGLAVRHALDRLLTSPARIKWPNDIYAGSRKLAGILVEGRGRAIVAGVGVNVNTPESSLPPEATSVLVETGAVASIDRLRDSVLTELWSCYELVAEGKTDRLDIELKACCYLTGRFVTLTVGDERIEGTVEGISLRGGLEVRRADGSLTRPRAEHTHIVSVG